MQQCAPSVQRRRAGASVHVLAMFVPSFFTGSLIQRVSAYAGDGAPARCCSLGCVAFALSRRGRDALRRRVRCLGVGWNFLHRRHGAVHPDTDRGREDAPRKQRWTPPVLATMTLTSFSSGALVTTGGWRWMSLAGTLVPLVAHDGGRAGVALPGCACKHRICRPRDLAGWPLGLARSDAERVLGCAPVR